MAGTESPARSVRFRFKNPRYDRIVRLNTESIARTMGFDEDRVFDITLAVEEAYANALEHSVASQTSAELELEIVYQLFPDRLVVTIQDSGCGFHAREQELVALSEETMALRGRGLGLIRTLSDHAEILSAPGLGTLIRITKFLPGQTGKPEPTSPTAPAGQTAQAEQSAVAARTDQVGGDRGAPPRRAGRVRPSSRHATAAGRKA